MRAVLARSAWSRDVAAEPIPEVSVRTEFFLVRIIMSPALPQKFPKIDEFEQTSRGHVI
jgi:hypothetical protein